MKLNCLIVEIFAKGNTVNSAPKSPPTPAPPKPVCRLAQRLLLPASWLALQSRRPCNPNLHWMGSARQRNSSLFALFRLAAARQSLLESVKKGVTRREAVAPGLAL